MQNNFCHKIYGGRESTQKNLSPSQLGSPSIQLPKTSSPKYSVVIGDEAHNFKSKSLVSIMSKLCDAKYRFGFTGTLDGCKTHKWVLEGSSVQHTILSELRN